MEKYGYIDENGILVSRIFKDRTETRIDDEGKAVDVILTADEQLEPYKKKDGNRWKK